MSPLGRLLGFELVEWAPERVVIKMPFRDDICTVGDLVHGGAISALADTTATAVAWSGVDPASPPQRGTTVSLAVDFMARRARARPARRGDDREARQVDLLLQRRGAQQRGRAGGAGASGLQARLSCGQAKDPSRTAFRPASALLQLVGLLALEQLGRLLHPLSLCAGAPAVRRLAVVLAL